MNYELQQKLNRLKKRYRNKYITSLLSKYTRPPKMFDRDQVALTKQIDKIMRKIEGAVICSKCNGVGSILENNELFLKDSTSWKIPLIYDRYCNNVCISCLGDGIVFTDDEVDEKRIIKNGEMISDEVLEKFVCPVCHIAPYWDWRISDSKDIYFSTCCGIEYRLFPKLFKVKVERKTDNAKDIQPEKTN